MNTIPRSTIYRLTATLFVGQGLALAAIVAATAVASITATQLAGTEEVAGLPSTFTLIGGALAAYPIGRLMNRFGRRIGLSLGYVCGILGGIVAGLGVIAGSLAVLLLGSLLIGSARTISDQSRYAAADVWPAHLRARAVSTLVFAGTIGAVTGPILAPFAGRVALSLGYAELAGPWFIASGLFVIALIFLGLMLRPDPHDIARRLSQAEEADRPQEPSRPARSFAQVLKLPAAQLALISLALAQVVMTGVMVITPVHMTHFNHGLEDIGVVLSAHVFGMFGLSFVTGWLTDRWGRRATIGGGGILLIAACLIAPQNPDTLPLALSLFLLGLGWNMCFVSGSALLTDVLATNERARVQANADLIVNLASAAGSLGSGFLIKSLGYGTVAVIGASLALVAVAAVIRIQLARPANLVEQTP